MNKALNVVICGYPKSGTTWLTRLLSECMLCPSAGYWDVDSKSISTEGLERASKFVCYKSHDLCSHLKNNEKVWKVISIVRNPKDIVVSGAYHFNFIGNKIKKGKFGRGLLSSFDKYFVPIFYKKHLMHNAIINGNKNIKGLEIAWDAHIKDTLNSNVIMVKYEELLNMPVEKIVKILKYLNYPIDIDKIERSIANQSFDKKKDEFKIAGNKLKAKHLRKGISEEWRMELNDSIASNIENTFNDTLVQLNYSVNL